MGIQSYGMAQRINPHSLREHGRLDCFKSNNIWHDEENVIDYNSEIIKKLDGKRLSIYNPGLLNRNIKLKRLLGKAGYKKVVNNVKRLSR